MITKYKAIYYVDGEPVHKFFPFKPVQRNCLRPEDHVEYIQWVRESKADITWSGFVTPPTVTAKEDSSESGKA